MRFLIFVVVFSTVALSARADTIALTCRPAQEMSGRATQTLLAHHIKNTLVARGWTEASVRVRPLRLQKQLPRKIVRRVNRKELFRSVLLSEAQGERMQLSLRGQLGRNITKRFGPCFIPVQRGYGFVTGSYIGVSGAPVNVNKMPISLVGLSVPGLLVPATASVSIEAPSAPAPFPSPIGATATPETRLPTISPAPTAIP